MDKTQREFVLRRQLDAIRAELGETGGDASGRRVPHALAGRTRPPDAVRAAVEREVDRLERMSEQSPEHGWIRTWLDTVFELPWGTAPTTTSTSPKRARSSTPTTPASTT